MTGRKQKNEHNYQWRTRTTSNLMRLDFFSFLQTVVQFHLQKFKSSFVNAIPFIPIIAKHIIC